MLRNAAAVPGHVWPGIRIHIIDIVQPPGIGIPPMADIDRHHVIVSAALPTYSSAPTFSSRHSTSPEPAARSPEPEAKPCACSVLVMAPPPDLAALVAPLRRAVEPRVHAPDAVYATRIRS